MIRPLEKDELAAVVDLHLASLSGLLTMLGRRAIRAFYRAALASEKALVLVDVDGYGALRGFVAGATDADDLRREVVYSRPLGALVALVGGIARRPRILWFLLSSVGPWSSEPYESADAELVYLAVNPKARGMGVGRSLVAAFGEALTQREITTYALSVDAENQAARRFYESLGFRSVARYREFGCEHIRLRFDDRDANSSTPA